MTRRGLESGRPRRTMAAMLRSLPLGLVAFTAAYLLAAVVGALMTGNAEFVLYLVVMLVVIAVLVAVHLKVRLHPVCLWLLSIWGLAHMAGGLIPIGDGAVLYDWHLIPGGLKFDQLVHAYGFGATTWLCWQILDRRRDPATPRTGVLVLAGFAGMGFGALNEVIEFVATRVLPETNVGGYVNTGWDLVANLVGVSVAVVLIALCDRDASRPTTPPGGRASG